MTVPESLNHASTAHGTSTPPAGTILIIGASALQVPMIERARQLGLRTLVVDADPRAPGAASADEFYPISTVDTEGIVELTRHRALVGATTVGTDAPIRSVAAVAAEHGLRAISVETARICTDKRLQAEVLTRARVRKHRFALASTVAELREAVAHTGLPCIVKPLDSSGSRGVVRVDDVEDLDSALTYALAPSRRPQVIVEELLVGREISCEVLCVDGEYHVVATTDKETTGSPHFIETGHTQPAALDQATLKAAHRLVRDALRAVGVDFGPAHVEMILTDSGPALVELGARLPGDFVSSHLVPLSTGTDLIGLVLRQACGETIEVPESTNQGGALRFLHAEPGTLVAYHGLERAGAVEGVSTIMLQAAPGHQITGMNSSTDRLGVIVAGRPDRTAAARACEKARDLITVEVAAPRAADDGTTPSPRTEPDAPGTGRPGPGRSAPLPARGRRVLVVGGGRGQVGLIRALKRLGATTVVASLTDGPPPGLREADEVIAVNILSVADVVDGARLANVDAVATSCLDTGLEALGGVVDALGLRGLSRATAHLCSDKLSMKRRFEAHGVPTAVFRLVTSAERIPAALEVTGLPAMVKATDLQGSSGVFKVSSLKEALAAFAWARDLSRRGTVIIERFLEGQEFGAQAFVHDGEVIHTTIHGDVMAPGPIPAPIAHYLPLDLGAGTGLTGGTADLAEQARGAVNRAVRALGLDNCAVNVDLIECDGTVHVIELTGRAGANGLPELMSAAHGLDYYELIAREALDLDVLATWQARRPWDGAVLGEMIIDPSAFGTVTAVSYPEHLPDWVVDLSLFRSVGDSLAGFSSSGDCLGQVVVRGADLEECRRRVDQVRAQVAVATQEQP